MAELRRQLATLVWKIRMAQDPHFWHVCVGILYIIGKIYICMIIKTELKTQSMQIR